jgi:integrase/recombinase XerD
MAELVPVSPLASPDSTRWTDGLALVGQWLAEAKGNTRTTYADAVGYPFHPKTAEFRDTSTLRNGVTWLSWCAAVGVHLLDADRSTVVAWTEDLREAPSPLTGELLSHTTRAHSFTVTSSLYRWLIEEGHTKLNPLTLVNRKKLGVAQPKNDSPTRSLSRTEVAQLQYAADHDPVEQVRLRTSALVATLYRLGMRVSELINANIVDIERTGGVRVLWVTLKGDRRHAYKLPTEVCSRLDRYLSSRGLGATIALRGQPGATSTPLFATGSGGRMDRGDIAALLQRLAEFGGVEDSRSVSPHTARHSLITALREAGVPDDQIRRFVGHVFASTTDRYGKHVLALMNSPADIADELFEQEMTRLIKGRTR